MSNLYRFRGYILGLLALLLLAIPGIGFPSKQTLDQSTDSIVYFMLWAPFVLSETLLLLAILLRVHARRSIGEHTRGSSHDADQLVTWGVYSKIRHPLYLSNTAIGISFALFHLGFSWETVLFAVVLVTYEFILSRMEDNYLENRFQDQWRTWRSTTSAFVPILHKVTERGETSNSNGKEYNRSFVEAFKADWSTWVWLCIFIVLLVIRKVL